MLEVTEIEIKPSINRLGFLKLKYYELVIKCDICLYKENKLWIRMPEMWIDDRKKRFVCWESQEISDEKQEIILNKVFDLVGLDLPKAVELKRNWCNSKKNADKNKENTYFTVKKI